MITEKKMGRKEFLKMTSLGLLGFILSSKLNLVEAGAAENAVITDNLSTGGIIQSEIPPSNTSATWINTGAIYSNAGVEVASGALAYFDRSAGTWVPITSTWS